MKNNYDYCIKEVLKSEGGYTNDPSDSGGETNFGITQKETSIPVKTMTVNQAKAIYKSKYWDALGCDNLPAGVDYTCFDYGVNSGLGRPRKALGAFKSLKGTELINAINDERMTFLRGLAARRPKDAKFLNGWIARVARVRAQSIALTKNTTTGPVAGGAAALGFWATLNQYIHGHPYITTAAVIAVGVGVWALVHYFKNRNNNVSNQLVHSDSTPPVVG